MKITFVGTGTMGCTDRANTSVLVDDILFDVGCGTVKQIEKLKIYTKSIRYIVISHFHADHFLDITNFLIGRNIRKELGEKLTIIGPVGIRKKVIDIMTFTHSDGNPDKYKNIEDKYNITFVELENGHKKAFDTFSIQAYCLDHGNCVPVNGYLLEKEGHKIAYCCDTTLCDNLYEICQKTEYLLCDVNGLKTKTMHIGLTDYIKMSRKYSNVKFYAIHRGDYNVEKKENIIFPIDGEIVEI